VQAPSQQQQPKAQIVAKGIASGGENPWGVQLKKNRRKCSLFKLYKQRSNSLYKFFVVDLLFF